MTNVKVQCPAKVNLTLKVVGKREDGFHNIDSIMQTISLYDYLSITVIDSDVNEIHLEGNSKEIPYDETNLVYKAAMLYLNKVKVSPKSVFIYIEKNIPVAAGLAGGSTDAAGTIYGLNKLLGDILSESQMHELCAQLGSDLNVCLKGGCIKASGRGEILDPMVFKEFNVSLIKPLNLGISAKEAYTKFSQKIKNKVNLESREKYINDLEWAIIDDYKELQFIKNNYPKSDMTGSGSTYFMIDNNFAQTEGYWVKNDLKTVADGVKLV
jgi:4-diphosphocytidyl-2-C-methyl-D-erythritol kinase